MSGMPTEPSFPSIAGQPLSRRSLLRGAAAVAAVGAAPLAWPQVAFGAAGGVAVWAQGGSDRVFFPLRWLARFRPSHWPRRKASTRPPRSWCGRPARCPVSS
ncbi:twin-arginine translocation signal domain-containing protein [Fodinicola feengrottensis]|uniref:twin-arginine translocation signal domain-containing protein n=1 Tax=Fodinicola feengrottensis TaxID=435914 RepID=UPI0036F34F4A